jgi:DNA-binding protein H-NS
MANKPNGTNDTIVIDTPAVIDINTMTDDQIAEFQKQRRIEKQKLAAEKGQQARKELEAYCQKKYGLTLQQIYAASGKTQELKTYRNPNDPDARPYTYSGRGKVPGWLKSANGKPNPLYEVKTN